MAVPVSFFHRERASEELTDGFAGDCETGAAEVGWLDSTGETPDTTATIVSW